MEKRDLLSPVGWKVHWHSPYGSTQKIKQNHTFQVSVQRNGVRIMKRYIFALYVKIWKPPRCPPTGEHMKIIWHICSM
jgi:hypothetical protein